MCLHGSRNANERRANLESFKKKVWRIFYLLYMTYFAIILLKQSIHIFWTSIDWLSLKITEEHFLIEVRIGKCNCFYLSSFFCFFFSRLERIYALKPFLNPQKLVLVSIMNITWIYVNNPFIIYLISTPGDQVSDLYWRGGAWHWRERGALHHQLYSPRREDQLRP